MGIWRSKIVLRLAYFVLLPVVLVYGALHLMYPTCTFRYKLTAEVMTPDGLKTGSSVIEVSYRNLYSLSGAPNLDLSARGEAVFVPIDNKRVFVVTLTDWESNRGPPQFRSYADAPYEMKGALNVYALPLKTFGLSWRDFDEAALESQVVDLAEQKRRFAAQFPNLPTLVVFEDVGDPDSVKVVQPDNLSSVLGDGYVLQGVWLEFVDEAPTNTSMTLFPWWGAKSKEWKSKWLFSQDDKLIDLLYYRAFKLPSISGNAE